MSLNDEVTFNLYSSNGTKCEIRIIHPISLTSVLSYIPAKISTLKEKINDFLTHDYCDTKNKNEEETEKEGNQEEDEEAEDEKEEDAEQKSLYLFKSDIKVRPSLYLCEITTRDYGVLKYGAIFPVEEEAGIFGVFSVPHEIQRSELGNEYLSMSNGNDLGKLMVEEIVGQDALKLKADDANTEIYHQEQNETNNDMENGMEQEKKEKQKILFSMKPPVISPAVNQSPEKINNPETYIQTKYYSSLYALTEPLNYFPKTALTRYRNMCTSQEEVSSILRSIILSINEFDRRYARGVKLFLSEACNYFELDSMKKLKAKLNILVFMAQENEGDNEEGKNGQEEQEKQKLKITGITPDQMQKVLLQLKIREAQLQIVILLEYFWSIEIDEVKLVENHLEKVTKELQKSHSKKNISLVRKKKRKSKGKGKEKKEKKVKRSDEEKGNNSKKNDSNEDENVDTKELKRITPKLLTNIGEETKSENDYWAALELFSYLNALVDRLNLWEVLLSSKDINNLRGFMAYVLIPYYHKRLPHLMKHIVQNMKLTNMKFTSLKKKKTTEGGDDDRDEKAGKENKEDQYDLERINENYVKDDDLDQVDQVDQADQADQADQVDQVDKVGVQHQLVGRPKLADGSANESIIKDISISTLRRSKSNLGQTKDLDKRQVNLDLKPSTKQESRIGGNSDPNSSLIFTKAKRSKSIPQISSTMITNTPVKKKQLQTMSFSQVEATPASKTNANASGFTEIFSPAKDESIFSSPVENFKKPSKVKQPNLLTQRLHEAAAVAVSTVSTSNQVDVEATPKKKVISGTGTGQLLILATPLKPQENGFISKLHVNSSSPVAKESTKPRPGDPNPVHESPMYNAYKNSNLLNFDGDQDTDEDSDEILNPKKKQKTVATYTRRK